MSQTSKPKPTLNQADIDLLKQIFTTKDDLSGFATKDDITKAITENNKHLFNYFASKDDIEKIVDQKLAEKIGNLPTKDEFTAQMAEIMGELKAIREEQATLTQHDQDQSDRLDNIESLHIPSHPHFSRS